MSEQHVSSEITKTQMIFDSRNAKAVYKKFNYYRTSNFTVPSGYAALVEITTPAPPCNCYKCICFRAVRTPLESYCYETVGSGFNKHYRRYNCCQSLGNPEEKTNGQSTEHTRWNKAVAVWGWDRLNDKFVEFEYITRPGNYYLYASKCDGDCLEDCDKPTFLEMTLIKMNGIPDLALPCC